MKPSPTKIKYENNQPLVLLGDLGDLLFNPMSSYLLGL